MRVCVKALFCAFVFVGLATRASVAADVPRPIYKAAPAVAPSFNWSGFYGGVHVGYGWSDGSVDLGLIDASGGLQGAAAAGVFPTSFSFSRDGVVGGVQVGFNRQIGQWVWGVEADISGADISGSQSVQRPAVGLFPNLSTVSQDMDWFGTARLRGGYAAGTWLLFGTGGLAYGHVEYSYLQTNVPFGGGINTRGSESRIELGWTAGGGVEYGWSNWSAKVEYLYYDLGDHDFTIQFNTAPPGVLLNPKYQNHGSILRVGLNYRFN
jgi:outer membrane immunogenic protein